MQVTGVWTDHQPKYLQHFAAVNRQKIHFGITSEPHLDHSYYHLDSSLTK